MIGKYLFISWIGLVLLTGTLWAGALLEVTPREFDFGRMVKNEGSYTFSYAIKNAGNEVLKIDKVQPGCGCTSVAIGKNKLAPGETTTLKGKLNTEHFEGPTQKSIMLHSNDGEQKLRILSLKIILPFAQTGPRLWPIGGRYAVHIRDGFILAMAWVENCDSGTPHVITGIDLPEGWTCDTMLPVTVKPEGREKLELKRPEVSNPKETVKDLPVTIYMDGNGGPILKGTLFYFEPMIAKPPATGPTANPTVNPPAVVPD